MSKYVELEKNDDVVDSSKKNIDRGKLIHMLNNMTDDEVFYLSSMAQVIAMEKNVLCGNGFD